ncbi:hypothetical protein RHOFW510R12_03960 [Rhodanobacter sp. FW510-R12]|uniref:hypothetical protein n=1 Tax=Rhodanobacter TaxID=75309 RepID=UPI000487817A|nr:MULTISPECIES: hypothetical protein [Rhodanobacter]TAN14606.1 MAG: hypothetical protein EPN35_14905 [Rhodanobacter sp.]UJJ55213.1 hypothetical protein LRK53_02075 [Rhodanobacter thiooxydans]
MTDKVEKQALLSRIDKFVTRSEFIAEQMKAERPCSSSAELANDMLLASHLVRQFVARLTRYDGGSGQCSGDVEQPGRRPYSISRAMLISCLGDGW